MQKKTIAVEIRDVDEQTDTTRSSSSSSLNGPRERRSLWRGSLIAGAGYDVRLPNGLPSYTDRKYLLLGGAICCAGGGGRIDDDAVSVDWRQPLQRKEEKREPGSGWNGVRVPATASAADAVLIAECDMPIGAQQVHCEDHFSISCKLFLIKIKPSPISIHISITANKAYINNINIQSGVNQHIMTPSTKLVNN